MDMDLDLDEMRAAKWWEVNIPPFGAVIKVGGQSRGKKYGSER